MNVIDKPLTLLKVEYAHILVDEMLLSPDCIIMKDAWVKISKLNEEIRRRGRRIVITISTEPLENDK